MVLLSQNFTPQPPPQPLGPLAPGHRRVVLTCSINMEALRGDKGNVMDVPEQVALDMVALGNAVMFDDLPEPEPEPEPELKCPYTNAPKRAWVEWAVAQGEDPVKATEMTKAQLQNKYGERL